MIKKLNYVKDIQCFVVKLKFKIIHIMCKIYFQGKGSPFFQGRGSPIVYSYDV